MSIINEKYSEGIMIKKNYPNGQLAIFYRDSDGEPVAELSVSEDTIELESNEIILKNYAENTQIAQKLLDSQIFIPTDRFVLIGSSLCPICKIVV